MSQPLPPLIPILRLSADTPLMDRVEVLRAMGFPLVHVSCEGQSHHPELDQVLERLVAGGGWPLIATDGTGDLVDAHAWAQPSGRPGGLSKNRTRYWTCLDAPTATQNMLSDFAYLRCEHGICAGVCQGLRDQDISPVLPWPQDPEENYGASMHVREPFPDRLPERLALAQSTRWQQRPLGQKGQGVVLVGGSGCGKSTLAVELGRRLGMDVVDVDHLVSTRVGKPIARIFAEDGEQAFRALESELACETFHHPQVVALGGGAWECPRIRQAARQAEYVPLWIAEDPLRIWNRIAQDPGRPLAQDRGAFMARWRSRLNHWSEAEWVLPLGRTAPVLAKALVDQAFL